MEKRAEFSDWNLDDRLLKGIARLGWAYPTEIQAEAIPLILDGKDVLVNAHTGTGKTAVFAIPIIQKIIQAKQESSTRLPASVKAVVMTPSRELCAQVTKCFTDLSQFCIRDFKVVNMAGGQARSLLADKPDVIVSTPGQILIHLRNRTIVLSNTMQWLAIDEADLILSYGHEEDIHSITKYLPTIYQGCLTSATLLDGVSEMKSLILHNSVCVVWPADQCALVMPVGSVGHELEAVVSSSHNLTQYHIRCEEEDKFLLAYALIKLRLVSGKTLIFVSTIDNCYRLKLFLEQFSIASCVLNSELPHNSRLHIVEQFNCGIYDIVIATDEVFTSQTQNSKSRKRKRDKEYGVSRGIDFQHVDNVVLFDFPTTVKGYIHCIGRTARGGETGTALSFVCSDSEEKILEQAQLLQKKELDGVAIKPYQFKMSEIEGFRYRSKDALSCVTKNAVRQARLKEIKAEILTSERLKSHFVDNPRDLQVLRHDQGLHSKKVQPHLKHVPTYLVPKALRSQSSSHERERPLKHAKKNRHISKKKSRKQKSQEDPLRTFDCSTSGQ